MMLSLKGIELDEPTVVFRIPQEFVRVLAKSGLYRSLFLEKFSNLRVVELNFQHPLGRCSA